MRKIFYIQRCRRHENTVDFIGGNQFRIQHQINIKIPLEVFLGLRHKLHIANTGNRMLDAMLLGQYTGHHVHFVTGRHGNEDIRIPHIRIVHGNRTGTIGRNREYIQRILSRLQLALVLINNHYIKLFLGQKLGNAVSQLSCANHDNTQNTPSPLADKRSYFFQSIITLIQAFDHRLCFSEYAYIKNSPCL